MHKRPRVRDHCKEREERTNIDTSYVMCMVHEELRKELKQMIREKGLSYESFALGFSEFLDKKGEESGETNLRE